MTSNFNVIDEFCWRFNNSFLSIHLRNSDCTLIMNGLEVWPGSDCLSLSSNDMHIGTIWKCSALIREIAQFLFPEEGWLS